MLRRCRKSDGKEISRSFVLITLGVAILTAIFPKHVAVGEEIQDRTIIVGSWIGPIESGTVKLRVALKIFADDSGKLSAKFDSLDQGVKDLRVDKVELEGETLTAEIMIIKGRFVGKLSLEKQEIAGTWSQGAISLPLILKKAEVDDAIKRPQDPKQPFPYKIEEVLFENKADKVRLAGTLSKPQGEGPLAAIVLVSGSGPHDRDASHLGHRPFLVLADYLTRRGLAVLRYDDRGIGKSKGEFAVATTQDFAKDASAAVDYLLSRPDIDKRRIGLCGHSEGGIIATLVASKHAGIANVVLMASPGVPGEKIIYRQVELMSRSTGVSEGDIAKQTERQRKLFASMKQDPQGAHLLEKMKELIATIPSEDERKAAEQSLSLRAATLGSPWFRMYLELDPRISLQRVTCPVLAVSGEKDLQVDPDQNLPEIESSLKAGGNRDFTIKRLPNLNHLFQTCQTGAASEYGQLEETISVDALAVIGDWLSGKMKIRAPN